MDRGEEGNEPLWRLCERRFAEWLLEHNYHIEPLADAVDNVPETSAPMVRTRSGILRAPDILTFDPEGNAEYWEVKYRSRTDIDESTGEPCYWVSDAALQDYLVVADRATFWIVLYEAPNAHHGGRWLRASAQEVRDTGRMGSKFGRDAERIVAWIWPARVMTIIDGPVVAPPKPEEPLLLNEGDGDWINNADLIEAEERQSISSDNLPDFSSADLLVRTDYRLSLEAVCRKLGLPAVPLYSVTRIGSLRDSDAEYLQSLIEYGLRVFIIDDQESSVSGENARVLAWRDTRLLEVAVTPERPALNAWIIDGQVPDDHETLEALSLADATSGFNLDQYRIIHAPADMNISVLAGAGTGKTETMAERMVFLLATSTSQGASGEPHPGRLKANDIAFITFTREAAAEMRRRLNRTLLLRQRLCSRPAQPFRKWASELTGTNISTIHSFAKSIIASYGADAGYGQSVTISSMLMPLRRLIQAALSPHLSDLYASWRAAPAEFEWQAHVEAIWKVLENRAPLMSLYGDQAADVRLGDPHGPGQSETVVTITNEVVSRLAADFASLCRDEGVVPLSQLIPLAVAILREHPDDHAESNLRHIFVDEFQDTDVQQIALVAQLMRVTKCRAFLVGDVKQGIYRFRGAAGDAFKQVRQEFSDAGESIDQYAIARNFRSTPALLRDMDRCFSSWGSAGYLDYDGPLQPMRQDLSSPSAISFHRVGNSEKQAVNAAVERVAAWRAEDAEAGIGILCRANRQAGLIKDALAREQIDCVTYTGGGFYQTPAVREFRCLLEAVNNPDDDAALLEVMETSWGGGIATSNAPAPLQLTDSESLEWIRAKTQLVDWSTRVTEFTNGSFDRSDIQNLRHRVRLLNSLTRRTSPLNLVTSMIAGFQPSSAAAEATSAPEGLRYHRCTSHLLTILVDEFEGGSATLPSMLEWLRLRIATDDSEDEPVDPELVQGDRVCVALTIHKAKGLQYDRVLIPFTGAKFIRGTGKGQTSGSIVDHGGSPRLLWKWNPRRSSNPIQNFQTSDAEAQVDVAESIREETRLLYVAMTRSRNHLVAMVRDSPSPTATPQSWNDLLHMGGIR